ncbi:hypothetical protein MHI01_29255 [Paenibacillus sp. FSL M7-0656]|uniref:hypothetical protein n=1 Tax=Paenibacillus TaxID=44249 RepID=UPI0028E54639|nr:hypothetical protein [Paenibacillus xylanexedens]
MKKTKLLTSFLLLMIFSIFSIGMASAETTTYAEQQITESPAARASDFNNNNTVITEQKDDSVGVFAIPDEYYPGTSTPIRVGDVLVTNSTSSKGLTGHAGIVTDLGGSVVSIGGYDLPLEKISISTWKSRNKNTKIMRYTNSSVASKAGAWAASYYTNYKSVVKYGLINTIGSYEKETYCSKIAWDAYYFGGGVSIDGHGPFWSGIYGPYHFLNEKGFSLAGSWGSNF